MSTVAQLTLWPETDPSVNISNNYNNNNAKMFKQLTIIQSIKNNTNTQKNCLLIKDNDFTVCS